VSAPAGHSERQEALSDVFCKFLLFEKLSKFFSLQKIIFNVSSAGSK
jgi:hypothetical protein